MWRKPNLLATWHDIFHIFFLFEWFIAWHCTDHMSAGVYIQCDIYLQRQMPLALFSQHPYLKAAWLMCGTIWEDSDTDTSHKSSRKRRKGLGGCHLNNESCVREVHQCCRRSSFLSLTVVIYTIKKNKTKKIKTNTEEFHFISVSF